MKKKINQIVTRYYVALASLPIIGGLIHFVVHTLSHLFGGGCP